MMVGDESDFTAKARPLLQELYGPTDAEGCLQRLLEKIAAFRAQNPTQDQRRHGLSQRDAVLITYGDMVRTPGQAPLATLYDFLSEWIGPAINTVHLLPFYPYSSDDGFSVLDYRAVDPRLGTWNDVERLASGYRLMFDTVVEPRFGRKQVVPGLPTGRPRAGRRLHPYGFSHRPLRCCAPAHFARADTC